MPKEVVLSSSDTQSQEEDFSVTFASKANVDGEETVIFTSEEIAQEWMTKHYRVLIQPIDNIPYI